tara:strand:+ start:605 stop:886 length:282 start_codon:yes stop_codon:yes gene_type:complete
MIGMVFNCLTVIGKHSIFNRRQLWLCKCTCGEETTARGYDLKNGRKKSCGHLRTAQNHRRLQSRGRGGMDSGIDPPDFGGWAVDDSLDEIGGG